MPNAPESMFYLGLCRVCETGPLGLRRCGGCERIVLLCDECDSVWPDNEANRKPEPAVDGALPCPHCHVSLVEAPSRWATRIEAEQCDWIRHALDAGGTLSQAAAFKPQPGPGDGA